MVKKIFLSIFISVVLFLAPDVHAAEEFATSYDVIYDVAEDGVTTVTEKIVLRNLTSRYYATDFKLTIGSTEISNIKASDQSGVMEVQTTTEGTSTVINVQFNAQIAGIDKELPWTLQFKSRDFAEKQGKIWQISAPKVSSSTSLENYLLTLSVPASFGEPSLISPLPKKQSVTGNKRFLVFDKSQLLFSGVSATFGKEQIYDFELKYNLENPRIVPVLTTITLPPDTAYQDVIFQRIEPKPLNVTVDNDGNFLAWYRLERNQKLTIVAVGSAKIHSRSKVKDPKLDSSLAEQYIESDKYWEKENPIITTKVIDILGYTPPESNQDKARLIHRYVSNYLRYKPERLKEGIERFGAVTALANPTEAVCMEFTDLFITLARAAGIPARELNGFAFTSNSIIRPLSLSRDVLHAWPEYWNDGIGWVMVDPTWESTTGGVDYFDKFDLNHFVFVIKGISSEQPVPAGSYKFNGVDSHDVKVKISDEDFIGKTNLTVNIDLDETVISGLPGKIKLKIINNGNALAQSSDLILTAAKLKILKNSQRVGPIPAFGQAEFEFDYQTDSLIEEGEDLIQVAIGKEKYTRKVNLKPFLLFRNYPFALIGFGLVTFLFYVLIVVAFFYRKKYMTGKNPKG